MAGPFACPIDGIDGDLNEVDAVLKAKELVLPELNDEGPESA